MKFSNYLKNQTLFIFIALILINCSSAEEEFTPTVSNPSSPAEISYSKEVLPIITKNCSVTNCHVLGSQSPNLSDKTTFFQNVKRVRIRVFFRNWTDKV